jgi:ABC-2 type transport system ATP-binding protein
MSEVEELCNRVAIISNGKIIRESSLHDLLSGAAGTYRLEVTDPQRARALCTAHGVSFVGDDRELVFSADPELVAKLSIALGKADIGIFSLVAEAASLEQLFLALTERDGGEPAALAGLGVAEVAS